MLHAIQRFFYRQYRFLKGHFLSKKPSMLGKCFFRLVQWVDTRISSRTSALILSDYDQLWRMLYFTKFSKTFKIQSNDPIATDSADHQWPRGTLYDNSQNRQFNRKAYALLDQKSDFSLMDLGCAGGGFVRSLLEDGFLALGLEGSDISKRLRSGEWGNIPYHLATCDITRPFEVYTIENQIAQFDMITAWDVLEHIPEERIPILLANIRKHLLPHGFFVGSVDCIPDGNPLTGAVYHVTLKEKAWWIHQFNQAGFECENHHLFEIEDYVRGNGSSLKDWDPRDGDGFHLVMKFKQ